MIVDQQAVRLEAAALERSLRLGEIFGGQRAAAPAAEQCLHAVEPVRAARKSAGGQLIGTVVVCIDNEPAILDGMQTLLGGWGCRVLTAENLAQAQAALEGGGLEPDGLLVDYHLDGSNGIGVISELRHRYGRDLPAILITADRSVHVREEARAAGVHILNKPVKPASLRALITQRRVQRVAAE